jgi:RHS repeat-associated protein
MGSTRKWVEEEARRTRPAFPRHRPHGREPVRVRLRPRRQPHLQDRRLPQHRLRPRARHRIYAGSTPYAGVPTYGYSEQNRLVTAKDANGATVTSVYDAFGRRIAWQTLRFVYDPAGRILEVSNRTSPVWMGDLVWVEGGLLGRVEKNVAAGVPAFAPPAIARFVPRDPAGWVVLLGASGSLLLLRVSVRRRSPRIAWASAASASFVLLGLACVPTGLEFYWIYTDQIGFPVAMTNTPATPSQAKVIWRASYEPFGLSTEELDPDGDGKQVRMPMRFPGQRWDFATNLHQNGFRDYDPATGRYLEADPVGQTGGVNSYAYAANDPVGLIDPLGYYGKTVHYFLTRDLALGAGMDRRTAEQIAAATQGMDKFGSLDHRTCSPSPVLSS